MLDLCLLGCGGSMPTPDRFLTSVLVSYNGRKLLIDCGEGTQVSLKINKLGFKSIDAILFTHFHADHIAGLPGLLLTIANSGREEPLTMIGPRGLSKVVSGLRIIAPKLPYKINLVELFGSKENCEKIGNFDINILPVDHGIECFAYSIYIRRNRKFDREKAVLNNVPINLWSRLQKEECITYNGVLYKSDMVLGEPRRGIKFSYCTDSRPIPELIDFVRNSDLFVCEGTYGDNGKYEKAVEYKHMLFRESAVLAKKSHVKELWLTHFSPSMVNPEIYLEDTRKIFENTVLGENGMKKNLNFEDDGYIML
ncbi:MAG: ribonuclease Z [Clostridium sp.]|jgi:ribonuclease Z|uniref:ribonuclease Z n=1 Tax=Clostridium sp. TaxID=1506 RepID=UPI0025BEB6BF|nr:ribonuclease Z [Clostridium sp.]MCH3963169.1 ribonuclease Z [Clostridium sp.]MCI1716368.1 ribonuclease Z [Clostridium sp.]MCI1800708.1 ribonuclease Z [Clostridium sp.]MCI1814637.1 ribonuclease Z [Clostridium sp.]MCI1871547.1 ribonuclease Z [Clostridium sp.]